MSIDPAELLAALRDARDAAQAEADRAERAEARAYWGGQAAGLRRAGEIVTALRLGRTRASLAELVGSTAPARPDEAA